MLIIILLTVNLDRFDEFETGPCLREHSVTVTQCCELKLNKRKLIYSCVAPQCLAALPIYHSAHHHPHPHSHSFDSRKNIPPCDLYKPRMYVRISPAVGDWFQMLIQSSLFSLDCIHLTEVGDSNDL